MVITISPVFHLSFILPQLAQEKPIFCQFREKLYNKRRGKVTG
ncbi:hypothetical protein X560_0044 [Listeria fleischmannii 1991]|uniref:Uncharacterized protein n=1 Tax=Listeria fleischmannii 1991 TaxID=1430899 RepID=A0A0J8JAH1_9LIST|nr:hypothetical protein X560_0044 [Listeria fleischmannii 1991]